MCKAALFGANSEYTSHQTFRKSERNSEMHYTTNAVMIGIVYSFYTQQTQCVGTGQK